MMTEQEAKEFMEKALPERFRIFMLHEMCGEEDYEEMMRNNKFQYLPILQQIKVKMPALFYAYFHDLLCEEEYERFQQAFMRSLGGMF